MHVHVSEIFVDSSVFTTNVQRDTGDESNELSEAISINHLDIYIFITSSIEEHIASVFILLFWYSDTSMIIWCLLADTFVYSLFMFHLRWLNISNFEVGKPFSCLTPSLLLCHRPFSKRSFQDETFSVRSLPFVPPTLQ